MHSVYRVRVFPNNNRKLICYKVCETDAFTALTVLNCNEPFELKKENSSSVISFFQLSHSVRSEVSTREKQ